MYEIDKDRVINLSLSMRDIFKAKKGSVWVSIDFSSQELRIAAALAKELVMLEAFLAPATIKHPITLEDVPNPVADLHIQAATSIFTDLNDVEPWDLDRVARKTLPNGKNPRKMGKILNFSIIYGKGEQGFADNFNVSVGEAKKILDKYFTKFHRLKAWLDYEANKGIYYKKVKTIYGRSIFIAEENAKGIRGIGSIKRKAPNSIVQGTASDMTKLALKYMIEDSYLMKHIKILNSVHDEINLEIPGEWWIKEVKTNSKGVTNYVYDCTDHTKELANRAREYMLKAESDLLSPLIGEPFPCEASMSIAPVWVH